MFWTKVSRYINSLEISQKTQIIEKIKKGTFPMPVQSNKKKTFDKEKERLLIERAKKGDKKAFEAIVEMYQNFVLIACRKRLAWDPEKSEDAAMEVFVKLWKTGLKSFRYEAPFSTYLNRIIEWTCTDIFKKENRLPLVPESQLDVDDCERKDGFLESTKDEKILGPEEATYKLQKVRAIDHCRKRLGEKRNIILDMIYFKGYAYKEVAELLDIPVGTVRSNLSRALRDLQKCLKSLLKRRS
ncbi:MAG TPA: sigma-70 family RNA polymerase sigma factor [Dissulfuribacter thermophilus]|uniref:Sigma-70 family RNA polymerase sigma factor n=1 Tax=Dissulfuribacter thermophilus TaxID=1156395 RepID=A0A7V2SYV0_9BACT|nr:sigma-70 family RNA polymerase sigma factor [Dissulfuribacter thermophilus]